MLGINGSEFIILAVLAIVILGPEKLPEYTRAFTDWLRVMRDKAEGAKAQFKEETGTDFDEVDWRKYDPRQYDPRRIIREAWGDTDIEDLLPGKEAMSIASGGAAAGAAKKGAKAGSKSAKDKAPKRAPFDDEAT